MSRYARRAYSSLRSLDYVKGGNGIGKCSSRCSRVSVIVNVMAPTTADAHRNNTHSGHTDRLTPPMRWQDRVLHVLGGVSKSERELTQPIFKALNTNVCLPLNGDIYSQLW